MTVCLLNDHDENCVRIYDSKGGHKLSLLPCSVDEQGDVVCVDLCLPSGSVVYCGVPIDLVNTLVEHLGLEPIAKPKVTSQVVFANCNDLAELNENYQTLRDAIIVGLGVPSAIINDPTGSCRLYSSVREMMLEMFGHDTDNEFPADFKREYAALNDTQ
jgi:hypothetical protein